LEEKIMPVFVLGIMAGMYAGNPKFKSQIDGAVKNLLGKGVDALNKGGGADVQKPEASPEE